MEEATVFTANFTLIVVFLLITIIPTSTILFLQTRTHKRASPPLPPGPWKLPVIGNLHQMLLGNPLPHRCLRDLSTQYGPLMHLQLGEVSTIVVSSSELVKEFLHTNDLNFVTRPYIPSAYTIFYQGQDVAFRPYGEQWKQMRKICVQELLSTKRVKSLVPMMKEEVEKLVRDIRSSSSSSKSTNISRMIFSLGNSITSRSLFGKIQKHWEAFYPVQLEIIKAIEGASLWDAFPSSNLVRMLTGTETKLKKLHKLVDAILENIIDDHKEATRARRNVHNYEAEDLVDVILNHIVQQDLQVPITNYEVKAVLFDLFIGGSDTLAVIVEWTFSELMKNSQVMEKVQKEVRKKFDGNGKIIDHYDLHQLHYLKSVIKETLRLHPPAPLLAPREARETVVIKNYQIPAKTRIVFNAWAIACDDRNWVEPDKFFPERFLDHNDVDNYTKGLDYSLFPFGAGRRMCPGVQYGMAVATLCIANLLYYFDWELPPGTTSQNLDMSEDFGITVRRKNHLFLKPIPYPYHHITPQAL